MKISTLETNRRTENSRGKAATRGSGGAFASTLRGATSPPAPTATAAARSVLSVGSILSVQETPDATAEAAKNKLRKFGRDVLDHLDDLRLGILEGAVSKERLTALARNLREKRELSDDPRLNAVIGEIELRAEVEIAKLTRKASG
jgi:hypothetical protein